MIRCVVWFDLFSHSILYDYGKELAGKCPYEDVSLGSADVKSYFYGNLEQFLAHFQRFSVRRSKENVHQIGGLPDLSIVKCYQYRLKFRRHLFSVCYMKLMLLAMKSVAQKPYISFTHLFQTSFISPFAFFLGWKDRDYIRSTKNSIPSILHEKHRQKWIQSRR